MGFIADVRGLGRMAADILDELRSPKICLPESIRWSLVPQKPVMQEASISIDTSISAAHVTLALSSERIDNPLVEFDSKWSGHWQRLEPETVIQIVLKATDEANARFQSNRHPHQIRYCVENINENYSTLARAAYAIVARLAVQDLASRLKLMLENQSQTLHELSRQSGFSKRVLSEAKNRGTLDGLELYQQIRILEYFGVIEAV